MARTVLIVEDDRPLAETLGMALGTSSDIETVIKHDGREAMEYLQTATPLPLAVLTDLDLPRMDGYQLIRWMRSDAALLRVPVLAMSARGDAQGALEAGADGFLSKPFSLAVIRGRIQELLNE